MAPIALAVALLGPASAFASTACPGDDVVPTVQTRPAAAMALVCDVNAVRSRFGLSPLSWNWYLFSVAQGLASDMAANHFFGHVDSHGENLVDRVAGSGYTTGAEDWFALENIAWGNESDSTPLATVSAWLQSAEHRSNLLDPQIREIGLGMDYGSAASGGDGGMFYVADFGARATAAAPAVAVHRATTARGTASGRRAKRRRRHARAHRHHHHTRGARPLRRR